MKKKPQLYNLVLLLKASVFGRLDRFAQDQHMQVFCSSGVSGAGFLEWMKKGFAPCSVWTDFTHILSSRRTSGPQLPLACFPLTSGSSWCRKNMHVPIGRILYIFRLFVEFLITNPCSNQTFEFPSCMMKGCEGSSPAPPDREVSHYSSMIHCHHKWADEQLSALPISCSIQAHVNLSVYYSKPFHGPFFA